MTPFISSINKLTPQSEQGSPLSHFKTSFEKLSDNRSRIMSHCHTSARDKTDSSAVGKSPQTTLLNSGCISLPKNVNTMNHLLFSPPRHCLHQHWIRDKITGVSLASLYMHFYSSRLMVVHQDLLSCYKLCLHDNRNIDAEKPKRSWEKIFLVSKGSEKGHTLFR